MIIIVNKTPIAIKFLWVWDSKVHKTMMKKLGEGRHKKTESQYRVVMQF